MHFYAFSHYAHYSGQSKQLKSSSINVLVGHKQDELSEDSIVSPRHSVHSVEVSQLRQFCMKLPHNEHIYSLKKYEG